MADYYDILNVSRDADEKQIRQAYRRLARQHHPDVNPGDDDAAERFKEINGAYEVLSDPDKRARYDRYGDRWERSELFEQQRAEAGPDADFFRFYRSGDFGGGPEGFGSLSDLLGGLGGFREHARRRPAVDVPVSITLEEADQGTARLMDLPDGRRLEVRIPAGIGDGGRVRIAPDGGDGHEFNLVVSVLPHARFERDGDDLHTRVDVRLVDAMLGGRVKVKTLRGQVELTLPAETQNGRRFRLAGQGMARLNDPNGRGDLFAEVKVVLPTGLTDDQRRILEQLREAGIPEPVG